MQYEALANAVIEGVGGKGNIASLNHCSTRLRFVLRNTKKADMDKLQSIKGVAGALNSGGQMQVIIGNHVREVWEDIMQITGLNPEAEDDGPKEKKGVFNTVMSVIPSVFTPILPAMIGCGMLKTILIFFPILGLDMTSTTYQLIDTVSDICFYFLPFLVAASASKVFKANLFLSLCLAGMLLHPSFVALLGTGEAVTLFGLPVAAVSYGSSLIPAVLGVWVMGYIERFLNKHIHKAVRMIVTPLVTILIMAVLMLVVLGPIGYYIGFGISALIMGLYQYAGWLTVVIIAVLKPLLVMTGMHYTLTTAAVQMFAMNGFDLFYVSSSILANLAQGAAAIGVALRSKDGETKAIGFSTGFSAIMGITEPAMFGINLRYKKPFIAAMIGAGAGGLVAGLAGVKTTVLTGVGITGLLGIAPESMVSMLIAVGVTMVVTCVLAFLFGITEKPKATEGGTAEAPAPAMPELAGGSLIASPLHGTVKPLGEVQDEAFAQGIIGKGVAVLPTEGRVYAPADGVVSMVPDTHHAIGITADSGEEILVHVGIGTVKLGGRHFTPVKKKGERVKAGELVLEFDLAALVAEGFDVTSPVLITNPGDFMDVLPVYKMQHVQTGDGLLAAIAK